MSPGREPPRLSVLTTRADEIRAELLVRLSAAGAEGGASRPCLQGSLTGPRRRRDTTLPTRVPLVACPGADGSARATFTEPAFWTPEMPNLYRLEARLLDGPTTVAEYEGMVGLRRLGVRGTSFWLDGRRWVPRVVGTESQACDVALLHDLHAGVEVRDPGPHLLAAADEAGVAVVARLEDAAGRPVDPDAAGRMIAGWALHPAAMVAVVPRAMPAGDAREIVRAARAVKGAMLMVLEVAGVEPPDAVEVGLAATVDGIVLDLPAASLPHDAWREWPVTKPLIARRTLPELVRGKPRAVAVPADRRAECDRLQAVLAEWGLAGADGRVPRDWAGYIVASW